jgi:cell division protease FtsH
MRVLCGGRLAEARKTGDISSGAAMDIKMVTTYARAMVLEWGMSEKLGFVRYAGDDSRESVLPDKDYSDDTARMIDEEIRRMADEAYAEARSMVETNWDKITAVAEALLRLETLQREEVDRLMRGEQVERPTVAQMLAAKPSTPPTPPATAGDEPMGGAVPSPA